MDEHDKKDANALGTEERNERVELEKESEFFHNRHELLDSRIVGNENNV